MRCPFCDEEHSEETVLGEFPAVLCPRIPTGYVYEDAQFEKGPPGRLHYVGPPVTDADTYGWD